MRPLGAAGAAEGGQRAACRILERPLSRLISSRRRLQALEAITDRRVNRILPAWAEPWTNSLESCRHEKALPRRPIALGLSWPRRGFGAGHCHGRGAEPRHGASTIAARCGESFVRTRDHAGGRAAAGD